MNAVARAHVCLKAVAIEAENDRGWVVLKILMAGFVKVDHFENAESMLNGQGDDVEMGMLKRRSHFAACQEGDRGADLTKIPSDLPGVFLKSALMKEIAFDQSDAFHFGPTSST